MTATDPILLPYQSEWLSDRSPVKVCEKSRQIGITWCTAADAVVDAASDAGRDWWISSYNKDQAAEVIRDVGWWVETLGEVATIGEEMVDDRDKQILVHVARLNSGNRITALPSSPRAIHGKRGVVVIDEFARHDDPMAMLEAALAMLIWGNRVILISTHKGIDSPFNDLCEDIRSGKQKMSLHRITFDNAIRDGLYRQICKVQGAEWTAEAQAEWREEIVDLYKDAADEQLFCIPSGTGGTYLSRPLVESCMVDAPIFRLTLPDAFALKPEKEREKFMAGWCQTNLSLPLRQLDQKRCHVLGEDFGRTADLTVFAPLMIQLNMTRRCPFLVELRNVPFAQQEQVMHHICEKLPKFIAAKFDATGNGQAMAEAAVLKYGEKVEAVMLNDRRYAEMLPPFRAAFEDRTILIPKDADVLSDLRQFQIIDGIPKLPKHRTKGKADQKPRHGDAGIALVLAYDASRADVPEIAYEPVRPIGMWSHRKGAL